MDDFVDMFSFSIFIRIQVEGLWNELEIYRMKYIIQVKKKHFMSIALNEWFGEKSFPFPLYQHKKKIIKCGSLSRGNYEVKLLFF